MKTNYIVIVFIALYCLKLTGIKCAPSPSPPFKASQPLPPVLDHSDKLAIAYVKREAAREKRGSASGSGDILQHLKKSIGQGIKNKISQIAKSSAGASAYFSHSSSGHHGHHGHHDYGHHHVPAHPPVYHHPHHYHDDHKGFDFWNLKKSVLSTLLQAVKAIKGGVIAIKGQLIKGSGHLLTAKGKLIRGGGEALTSIGKHIASSAFMLVPPTAEDDDIHTEHEHYVHAHPHPPAHASGPGYEYSAPTGPTHGVPPSGPALHYGSAPSAPSAASDAGGYYHNSIYDGKEHQQHADGLIILRKVPKHLRHPSDNDDEHTQQHQQHHEHNGPNEQLEHYVQQYQQHDEYEQDTDATQDGQGQASQKAPAFKPLSNSIVPNMKNLVGSVFHSSSGQTPPATHETPKIHHTDNVASHSGTKNVRTKPNNEKILPQQAHIGTLMNYLEYIRGRQKLLQQNLKVVDKNKNRIKSEQINAVFVTPTPSAASIAISQPSVVPSAATITNTVLPIDHTANRPNAAKIAEAEQQLKQQTSELQAHIQQLQAVYQYLPQNYPQNIPVPQQAASINPNYAYNYNTPTIVDLGQNVDLATLLAQYETVPIQVQPQPAQLPPTQNIREVQVASSPETFLIHYPDYEELQGRSLNSKNSPSAKVKRHYPHSSGRSATRKLSQLQQLQLLQQQLYYPQTSNQSTRPNRSAPTLDFIRAIEFETRKN